MNRPSKRPWAIAALTLAALTLSACERGPGQMAANGKICVDFKAKTSAAAAGSENTAAVDTCIQRWAYSLASSRDNADMVADAAVAACSGPLSRWNQAALAQPDAETESASLLTGQPTTALGEHSAFAHGRALFYVVQARAGNCAPPPATNGVPEGVT